MKNGMHAINVIFSSLRRLWTGKDSLKGNEIHGCFLYLFYFLYILIQCIRARPFDAKHGALQVYFRFHCFWI